VIPAGLTFANAISKRSDLGFIRRTKGILTMIGTYLGACTIYASVYRKSPVAIRI